MEMSVHGLSVHGLLQLLTHAHTHTPGKLPTCAVTKTNMSYKETCEQHEIFPVVASALSLKLFYDHMQFFLA